ncbi:phosphorylase family protein [Streptomyces sp. NPDC004561]
MTSTADQLQALLGDTAFRALESLARSNAPVSGRALARALDIAPTTATSTLATLKKAGFVTSTVEGRSTLWRVDLTNPRVREWLYESAGLTAGGEESVARPRMTAVVFTALQDEYEAVAAHLPARRTSRVRTTRFEVGAFAGDHIDWTVYVAEVGEGNTRTAAEFASATAALDPQLVFFVGVAGSVKPEDLVRGDVVVADRVYDMHRGKDVWDEVKGSIHLARLVSFPAANRLVHLARHVRRGEWTDGLPGDGVNARGVKPRVEIKAIAAGQVVHADARSALMEKVRRDINDAAAVDMESFGLYETSHMTEVAALAVRGISDSVDDKAAGADRKWQPLASGHAAAFAFALLRQAEPEDLPPGGSAPAGTGAPAAAPSAVESLLRVGPHVALAYQWAVPLVGARATVVVEELANLGGQPGTWLSRFKRRPPQHFRDDDGGPLWVLVAEFAHSHDHATASWLFEQAARRSPDGLLSAYLYGRAAGCALQAEDPDKAGELFALAEEAAPAGRPLWELYRALSSGAAAVAPRLLAVAGALELPLPKPAVVGLGGAAETLPVGDDEFVEFVADFAERYPAFLESVRLNAALTATVALYQTPGQIDAALILAESLNEAFAPYRPGSAGMSALAALRGPRSSAIAMELARTLVVKAADQVSRVSGFDRDAALSRAEGLALAARGRRLDWNGPTAEALTLAAQARALTGDDRGALAMLLPPPAGTAEPTEATSGPVVLVAAGLAAQTGTVDLALELSARIEDPVERRLMTALALAQREDSRREAAAEFRAVLGEIAPQTGTDQQLRALLGLSLVDALDETELSQLEAFDTEIADLTRAQSLLRVGDVAQAQILARRYPDSERALQIRGTCLLRQGDIAGAVGALERFAEQHNHDERHRLSAALLAHTHGMLDDAERLATRLTSSDDAFRRRTAREILLDTAARREAWTEVLAETRRLLADDEIAEADPNHEASRINYRWASVHALHQLRRMDEAYQVIRSDPRLKPTNRNQARLLASVLRTIAPSITQADTDITQEEVLSAATEAAQAFPDDEELVATAVMTGFAMPAASDNNYRLMAKARDLHQAFFERFPDSNLIEQVPVDDTLDGLKTFLRTRIAPTADAAAQMESDAAAGQLPISVVAGAFGHSYADALIRNIVRCYVVRAREVGISSQEIDAARQARNATVVVDTSALFLSPTVLGDATQLREHFEQLLVTAAQRDDILQARSSLSVRSSGWLGWDSYTQRPVFTEYSEKVTQRWADRAATLAAALGGCDVVPVDPPSDHEDARHRVWSSPIRLARERGVSLVADDAVLRAVARSEGVPAFGSLQLLEALVQDGALPTDAIRQAHRRLMELPAAELPVLDQLHQIAREDDWKPSSYAAFLLTRASTWQPVASGWFKYKKVIEDLPGKDPELAAEWCLAALSGLRQVTAAETLPTLAGALIAWTLFETHGGTALPRLLENAQRMVRHSVPQADLLEEVVRQLVMTGRRIAPAELVGSIVVPLLSGLENEERVRALKLFFTMP